ncbi:Gfo/Idh/MocA family protein [Paenibacillus sp. MBLB4367]|uniref:Gfo/Idh/MocA family protein n=1 Tax=Paenibacillus sp. MBLB4367 TaxID=3384767 RepID=UPI0039083012
MKVFRAAIVGIGGFGANHVKTLAELVQEGRLEVTAFAELNAEANREMFDKLTAMGASHYTEYERMLTEHPEIDFVAIATPIAAHKPMCIKVLQMGFHVLVEKPPAVTIQDIDDMLAAQRESGRLCQVNFQNTSGRAFRELLQKLSDGAIGRLSHIAGVATWKRNRAYYDRTRWAGKLTCDGQYVLDGTFNNPLAHLLNNCLLAANGADPYGARPESVQAELYHVNDIEGDDVSCMRIGMSNDVTVHFYAMLSHERNEIPYLSLRGTEGEALWTYDNVLTIRGRNGEESCNFGPEQLMRNMYLNLMQAIEDDGTPLYSPLAACRSFVLASNGAYESSGVIRAIPEPYIREQEDGQSTVRLLPGLSEHIKDAAVKGLLYSEYPFPWAVPTSPFRMADYRHFELPSGMKGK